MGIGMVVSATSMKIAVRTLSASLEIQFVRVFEVIVNMMMFMIAVERSRRVDLGFLQGIKGTLLAGHMLLFTSRKFRTHTKHVENL